MRRIRGSIDLNNGNISVDNETLHHLKVIRVNDSEILEVVDQGKAYKAVVKKAYPLELELLSKDPVPSRELPFTSVLLLPLLKHDNFELCLQKATELGVSLIVPFISERVIKRVTPDEFEERRARYLKIIKEAVLQSNRTVEPELSGLADYRTVLKTQGDLKLFAYEEEAFSDIRKDLKITEGMTVVSLIGPEGGFSPLEAKEAEDDGFLPLSLGKRILRAETAVISLLSDVDFLGE